MVLTTILGAVVLLVLLLNYWGLSIRNNGMRPIVKAELDAHKQKLATAQDGRQVACCTYGSQDLAAPVVINMHSSELEAGFERSTYKKVCTALNCRGIAISLPGCGFTDQKPGHQVKDWPCEDLIAVLNAERVDKFHITEHSQGTPHAMAAALYFSDRCLGIGLNAPLLPTKLCQQLGMGKTIGTG